MKYLTAVALAGLFLSLAQAGMLKKASKALGGYVLIKALEPKPPQMVGIMMPMPMMMDPPASMMEAAKPMPMMEPAKTAMMMGGSSAMMMGGGSAMMTMMLDNPMMKAMMKEPAMQQAMKPQTMDAMKMMMATPTPSAMNVPAEPSDRQVLAALHAMEHNHAHHHTPRNLHIH